MGFYERPADFEPLTAAEVDGLVEESCDLLNRYEEEESVSPTYFCPYCGKETRHVNVSKAAEEAQVTRTTVYAWIRKREVHCVHRPSGRTFICTRSLLVNDDFYGQPAI